MYSYKNGKMRPVETLLRIGKKVIKDNDGGGEFNLSTFVKCHNVPPVQQ
jgi:hypothetical protein